jgi:hypothetical protein
MSAGEHRYEDSYFMKHNRDATNDDNKQDAKRARTIASPKRRSITEMNNKSNDKIETKDIVDSSGGKNSKFQCAIQ